MNRSPNVRKRHRRIFQVHPDLPDYGPVEERLWFLGEENDGWGGPDSKAMSPDSCLNAISVLTKMQKLGIPRPNLVLTLTGHISAIWKNEPQHLAVVKFYARKYMVTALNTGNNGVLNQEYLYASEINEHLASYLKETY